MTQLASMQRVKRPSRRHPVGGGGGGTPPGSPNDFSTLQPGFARNLGPWTEAPGSTDPNEQNVQAPSDRSNWGCLTYSAAHDAFYLHGGHHGLHLSTAPRKLQPHLGVYRNVAPTTPIAQLVPANCDSTVGRWISHNAPWARHTYQAICVMGNEVCCFAGQNSHNAVNGNTFPPGDGRAYFFDTTNPDPVAAFRYSTMANISWHSRWMAAVAISSRYAVVVNNAQSNFLQCWLYDRQTDTRVQMGNVAFGAGGWTEGGATMCYDGTHCYVSGPFGRVYKVTVNIANPSASFATELSAGWAPMTTRELRIDYDPINNALVGGLLNGTLRTFNLATNLWQEWTIQPEGAGVPNSVFWCSAFDSTRGVFVSAHSDGTLWVVRPPSLVSAAMRVELDFGGGQVANFTGGTDIGTYHGEHVHQRCFLATDPAYPDWRVMFRPDENSTRREVVVEYGRAIGGTPANRTTPYTARIYNGSTLLYEVVVPTHWWYARWRWQSAPRPEVRTTAELVSRNWIANFQSSALFGRAPYTANVTYEGPMTLAGNMATTMGSAGENQLIGHLTEAAAEYVVRPAANHITTARTEAEAVGTWTTHIRLPSGAMPDIRTGLNYIGDGGTLNQASGISHPEYVALAESHWWPCANLPYLLTDDPYWLEEIQFGINWRLLYNAYARNRYNNQSIVVQQPRSWGWALRDQFLLAVATPEVTPSWLQPRSAWLAQVADNLAYAKTYVHSGSAVLQRFRFWLDFRRAAVWMLSFINASMGQAVKQGHAGWREIFEWGVKQHIDQISGTSGWDKRLPTPYFWYPLGGVPHDEVSADGWPDSPNPIIEGYAWTRWKDASDDVIAQNFPGQDPNTWDDAPRLIGQSYALQIRAALALAAELGIAEAVPCMQRMSSYITYMGWDGMTRFAIEPLSIAAGMTWKTITSENALMLDEGAKAAMWMGSGLSQPSASVVRLTSPANVADATRAFSGPTVGDFIVILKVGARMVAGQHASITLLSGATEALTLSLGYDHFNSIATQGVMSVTNGTAPAIMATGLNYETTPQEVALHVDRDLSQVNLFRRVAGAWVFTGSIPFTTPMGTLNSARLRASATGQWIEFDWFGLCRPNAVVIGDSIAAGHPLFDPNPAVFAGTDNYASTWMAHAGLYPTLRNSIVVNKGLSGETSAQTLARISQATLHSPKTVFLHASSNDLATVSLAQRTTNIQSTVNAINAAGIKAVLLNGSYGTSGHAQNVSNALRDYMKGWWDVQRLTVTGLATAIDTMTPIADGSNFLSATYAADTLHPNVAGYTLVGQQIGAAT